MAPGTLLPTLLTDVFDLVLGRCCLGCERPGPGLCDACLAILRADRREVRSPSGLPPLIAATAYDGLARRAILDYKERGNRALAAMLGTLLGDAVAAHLDRLGMDRCVIVPVPSHRHAPRGFDALGAVAAAAQRRLSDDRVRAVLRRPIRSGPAYRPLKGLGREERHQQVAGAFRPGRRPPDCASAPVILVDDVVTSGATVGEALRCLARMSIDVAGIAAIASASRDTSARIPAPAPPTHRR